MVYDILDDGILLRVRLMPNSSCCRLNGIFTDAAQAEYLKICIVSVAEKGRANKELLTLLAKKTNVAKSACEIIGGELDRYKRIKISGEPLFLAEKIDKWIAGEKE